MKLRLNLVGAVQPQTARIRMQLRNMALESNYSKNLSPIIESVSMKKNGSVKSCRLEILPISSHIRHGHRLAALGALQHSGPISRGEGGGVNMGTKKFDGEA